MGRMKRLFLQRSGRISLQIVIVSSCVSFVRSFASSTAVLRFIYINYLLNKLATTSIVFQGTYILPWLRSKPDTERRYIYWFVQVKVFSRNFVICNAFSAKDHKQFAHIIILSPIQSHIPCRVGVTTRPNLASSFQVGTRLGPAARLPPIH